MPDFIPHSSLTVCKELSSLGLAPNTVLVLDNCSAHPNVEDLVSDYGKITAHYLPPNVTSLIQPMDQGVLVALKHCYRKKLLRRLLIEDENSVSLIEFLKSVNMSVVVEMVAESWDEIKASTLRKSWRKIMPIQPSPDQSEDLTVGQEEDGDKNVNRDQDEQEFVREFQELGYSMDENEIHTWLNGDSSDPGFQLMTDDEICEHVLSKDLAWKMSLNQSRKNQIYALCPIPWQLICSTSALHGLNTS